MQSSIGIGLQAFREGRFDEAVALFEEVGHAQAGNDKIAFLLAQGYQALGRHHEARLVLNQLLGSSDPQLAVLASKTLEGMGELGLAAPEADAPPEPEVYCPRCGEAIPAERLQTAWCVCGWGARSQARVIYLSHLLAYCRTKRIAIEFKLRGDLYLVANDVRIRHMSDQATKADPRLVFRTDRGVPFIAREDLDLVIPKVDERALFREKRGRELGAGKLLGWEDFYELLKQTVGDPSAPPDGSLRAMLMEFGGISDAMITEVEADLGTGTLGTALVSTGACSVFELLSGALGPTRVFAPRHHQGNHLGRLLLEAGAIDEAMLKRAVVNQVKTSRPLAEILKTVVPPKALKLALGKLEKLPIDGPERDRLGEVLNAMGTLSRTDLAHALQERQKRSRLLGKILLERGMVNGEALFEALKRQELKREARFNGEARIGQILISKGFATPKTIAMALVEQISRPRPLGELLIESGACTPEQLITALAEQESRLDALVEERLPEALEKARQAHETVEEAPKAKLKRMPLPDELEDEEEHVPKPFAMPSRRVLVIGGAVLALGLAGMTLKAVLTPKASEAPPMVKAMGEPLQGGSGGSPRKSLSSLNAVNTVNVDVDAVVERMEAGDPNPLGPEYMGAYQQALPPSLEQMAARTVGDMDDRPQALASGSLPPKPVAAATPLPRLAEYVRPQADEDPGEDPARMAEAAQQAPTETLLQGEKQLAMGRPQQAVATFRKATAEIPDDPEAFRQLGRAQRKSGQLADAEVSLLRAAQLNPQDPQVLSELGTVRMAQGRVDQAIEAYQMAVKRDPQGYVYQNKLGLALKAKGRTEEAMAAFEAALEADPGNPNSHYNLGLMKVRTDPKAARNHYGKAVKGFSNLVESRMAYGEALKAQGDVPEALSSFQGALKANTLLAESQMALGKLAVAEKRFDEARQFFGAAKLTYATNAIAHSQMGDAFYALKQVKEASEEWFLACRIAPSYAPPFLQLGLLSKASGKVSEARSFLKQAIDADPSSEEAQLAQKHLQQLDASKKKAG